jgi:hypothetical protein
VLQWRRRETCKCTLSVLPTWLGTASSFYRPRGGGLQPCRTVLATCDGMPYSAMEWVAVLANLASGGASRRALFLSRSGFEGSGVGYFLFGRRPYINSWVMLTEGGESHSNGRGDVPSSCDAIVPGMALQCPGWRHSGGDGRTGRR